MIIDNKQFIMISQKTKARIEAQELQDRYVATKCLKKILTKGRNLKIKATPTPCSVDLKCSVVNEKDRTVKFNVEVKERNKSEWQIKNYPEAELKVEKYERMREATPEGTKLLYMVLLNNQKCLIFDMDKLDWSKVEQKDWVIKKTQMDDDSPVVSTPTYFIPYNQAVVTTDCTEYITEYYTTITNKSYNNYE